MPGSQRCSRSWRRPSRTLLVTLDGSTGLNRIQKVLRGRPWILALLILGLILLVGALSGAPRSLAVTINDRLGIRQVEGHLEKIEDAARESSVEPALIGAVMFAESRGRGGQTSHAGALGLMQLIPAAASDAARRLELPEPSEEEVRDDDVLNVRLGASHLRWLLDHRGEWTLEQVLVAYNAGRTRLFRWIEKSGSYAAWRSAELKREASGEKSSGALRYALEVLEVRRLLLERGRFRPLPGISSAD